MATLEKYKKGYKVVSKYTLTSAIIANIFSMVTYKINEWVKPKQYCGPLCVFDDYTLAYSYADSQYETVYECLYEQSLEKYVYMNKESPIGLMGLPYGTVLASKVKLLRRVR